MSSLLTNAEKRPTLQVFDPGFLESTDEEETPLTRAVREIEEDVMREFADRWNRSGWLGRLILNYRMKIVINDRFEKLRPRLPWLMQRHFRNDSNSLQLHVVNAFDKSKHDLPSSESSRSVHSR